MTPGNQATQAAHAALSFAAQHPEEFSKWHSESQYLVLLASPTQEELARLASRVMEADLKLSLYHEPDYNDELTAIVVEPSDLTRRLMANLPLALREASMA
jgi:hypothetical protein